MSSTAGSLSGTSSAGILDRERIVARAGFNRWLVPPAALAIHLCIGMAYGFSVFWLPLSRAIGITKSIVCANMTLTDALFTTTCDWRVSDLGWMYHAVLRPAWLLGGAVGRLAGARGTAQGRRGGRAAAGAAECCSPRSALRPHQLWMLWLGSGVIGGIGLGLGYISPVSTLIKWFPDRRGMATGMAIMGFGGGAMIGAPLADMLMRNFRSANDVGVWQTFVVLAADLLRVHARRRLRLPRAAGRLAARRAGRHRRRTSTP